MQRFFIVKSCHFHHSFLLFIKQGNIRSNQKKTNKKQEIKKANDNKKALHAYSVKQSKNTHGKVSVPLQT